MNGFILVFGMVLVLAAERRLAADRAAAGGPARSRQSPPRGGVPVRSRAADGRPPVVGVCPQPTAVPWPSAQPAADGPARGRVSACSRRPNTMIGFVCGSASDARCCTYDSAPRARRRHGCGMARNEHAVLSRSCGATLLARYSCNAFASG